MTDVELTPGELAAAKAFGISPEEYAKYRDPDRRAGISAPGEPLTEVELLAAKSLAMSPEEYANFKQRQPTLEEPAR